LTEDLGEDMVEGVRKGGDLVRLDTNRNAFGVISNEGVIRTYFIPVVADFAPWDPEVIDYFIRNSTK
jgi:hypothetical protein